MVMLEKFQYRLICILVHIILLGLVNTVVDIISFIAVSPGRAYCFNYFNAHIGHEWKNMQAIFDSAHRTVDITEIFRCDSPFRRLLEASTKITSTVL